MALDVKALTKDWITYLKGYKIVSLKSDPQTGKLDYKRPVTSDDIKEFLNVKTDFTDEEISNAIYMVMAKKGIGDQPGKLPKPGPKEPGRGLSTWMYYGMTPGERPESQPDRDKSDEPAKLPNNSEKDATRIKYDPNSVSDVEYRDIPPDESKGSKRPRFKPRKVDEDISDLPEFTLDEKDVELIFKILASGEASEVDKEVSATTARGKKAQAQISPEEEQAKKEEDMRKMKRLIRDVMTDSQRKAFWRMLNDQETLEESQINNADIKEILKTAAEYRNTPRGLGKVFKGLRKDKIDLSDLQQAWKEEGYPDDTRDIKFLLLGHGFSEKDIKDVFSQVFGVKKDSKNIDPDIPTQSATLLKLVRYAKKNNLTQDLINFMSKEYGFKESIYNHKIMIEDVGRIFSVIIGKDRSNREELVQLQDKVHLGRAKK